MMVMKNLVFIENLGNNTVVCLHVCRLETLSLIEMRANSLCVVCYQVPFFVSDVETLYDVVFSIRVPLSGCADLSTRE